MDHRLGGFTRYHLTAKDGDLMQIPPEVQKCVAFVCFKDKEGIKLAGTVFFITVSAKEIGYVFGYAVTARHVIAAIQQNSIDGKVLLRVNMKNAPSQVVETHVSDWRFHPNDSSVDVAVLPTLLPQDQVDFLTIPIEMAATDQVIQEKAIGVGDEVFLTGLFVNHAGQQRNLPIVRTGNIALMPEERVQTKDFGPIDAFLVEARSIGGLSGSPVFAYLGPNRMIGGTYQMGGGNQFFWLGLMHGHWDAEMDKDSLSEDDLLSKERVNMGIAIVVPVSKILEVINQEALLKTREKLIEEKQKDTLPTSDTSQPSLTKEGFKVHRTAHSDARSRWMRSSSADAGS